MVEKSNKFNFIDLISDVSFALSGIIAAIAGIFTLYLWSVHIETNPSTTELILHYTAPLLVVAVVFAILVEIRSILENKLVKFATTTKDTKVPINPEDGSSVSSIMLNDSNIIEFTIQGDDYKVIGSVNREDVNISEKNTSYAVERITSTTSKLFSLNKTEESKSYLLYLKPDTFDSLKGTFID